MAVQTTSGVGSRETTALDRLSDRALFSHAARDEAAFGELVRRYREPLRRHAARYVGDADAEDVVQQALVNANLALRRHPERDIEPRPWLYKVTTNAAIDHRRARAARPLGDRIHEEPDYEALGAPDSDDPHQVVAGREAVRSLVARIQSLAPNQRRAATARFLEGRSHDEIADELGVSRGAARELIHRARRNLREALPALSPLPLLEKLRHGIGALFAGSSPPAAKLAAGAAAVAVATGGGAAVVSSNGDGSDGPERAGAGGAAPAAAVAKSSEKAAAGGEGGPAARAGEGGGAPERGRSEGPAGSGRGQGAGSDAGAGAGADDGPGTASGTGTGTGTGAGSGSGAPTSPVGSAVSSATDAAAAATSSNPVQSAADQLGVGGVTQQLPNVEVSVPPIVNDVTDKLPIETPDLPSVSISLGGGG